MPPGRWLAASLHTPPRCEQEDYSHMWFTESQQHKIMRIPHLAFHYAIRVATPFVNWPPLPPRRPARLAARGSHSAGWTAVGSSTCTSASPTGATSSRSTAGSGKTRLSATSCAATPPPPSPPPACACGTSSTATAWCARTACRGCEFAMDGSFTLQCSGARVLPSLDVVRLVALHSHLLPAPL